MVLSIEVIEHIEDDSKVLRKFNEMLKEDGIVLITVPIHEKYRR
jgi:2-polyprenyl-3-methyl-5-hydroxy-6-metoxy-1,4-benzoquinol methylase